MTRCFWRSSGCSGSRSPSSCNALVIRCARSRLLESVSSKPRKILGLSALSLLATAVLGSGTAHAATQKYKFDGQDFVTQPAGKKGDFVTGPNGILAEPDVRPPSGGPTDFQGIYEISMWEQLDYPCRLRVRSRHLNNYEGRQSAWARCDGSNKSLKTLKFADTETYISGINVCLNKKGTRIKGLRIFGSKLNRNTGNLTSAGSKEWERPNCKNWQTARHCPTGQLAQGIRVEYNQYTVIGLRLICREVIEKPREVTKQ